MCGRYQFTAEQSAEILHIIQTVRAKYGEYAWTPGEISPTAMAPVLVAGEGGVRSELFRWGFHLPDSLVINARAETAAEKPLFRESVASRRCVIPSTGFFEWDREKRKYLFTLPGCDALYMAGLWSIRGGQPCYCILTSDANESMRAVHHRMPLVLRQEETRPWLEQPEAAREFLHQTPPELTKQSADEQFRLW